jgi:signal transduction histidine kinase
VIDRRVVALVQLNFRARRALSAADQEFANTLCSRAAQTLDRTWRHEAADRARFDAESLRARADSELIERQRTEQALRASETRYRALATRTTRLHALTAGLSEAATVQAVARVIVQQARAVVGAGAGELSLLVDNGRQFERLYAEGFSDGSELPVRSALEPGLCSTEAVHGRAPVFIGSFAECQDKYWSSASSAADNGFASMAALPLVVDSAALGVLAFHFSVPVNFDEEYQALLISVAQHCTQALDRTRLYEAAQRARAEAETANRLKDEFVSMVSHELRTPLNAILGWASMLRTGSLDQDVVPRAVDAMYRNATRQAKLVDDLLDFSRIAAGRVTLDLQTIDAETLLRSIVESVIPLAAAKQIDLQASPFPDAMIRGDVRRLEQVFTNLLGNALKFTPTGGRVEITARVADRALEIRVTDTGIGIPPEFMPFVFDRFRQGDSAVTRSHGGVGLGLAIARQLVEAHRGTIVAESGGTHQGTTFVVTLPVVGQTAGVSVEAAAAAPVTDRPKLDGIRVLIVDDENDTREMIGQALKACGASISLASRATDAFEILNQSDFDVLLADIAMPDEDGYSLIRRIRASPSTKLAAIPAAAVTAHARDDERRDALAAGFQIHVAKPIEPFELAQMVDRLVHSRSPPL